MKETSNRASRDRRVLALLAWAALIVSAFNLWNSRMTDSIFLATPEPIAFILAAFGAFVGVFAWMLFNPGHRSAAESPELFFAAIATLFPPPVIAFCLMPAASPLRWWLAIGIFILCVIAVLSHVPDEFFAVPRNRATYFAPIPTFDKVYDGVMDPHAEWFTFQDLSRVVADVECPSLSPRAYLQQESGRSVTGTGSSPARTLMPVSDIDDILGSDFDEDFFADDFHNENTEEWKREEDVREQRFAGKQPRIRQEERPVSAERQPRETVPRPLGPPVYTPLNALALSSHRNLHKPASYSPYRSLTRRERLADSISIERTNRLPPPELPKANVPPTAFPKVEQRPAPPESKRQSHDEHQEVDRPRRESVENVRRTSSKYSPQHKPESSTRGPADSTVATAYRRKDRKRKSASSETGPAAAKAAAATTAIASGLAANSLLNAPEELVAEKIATPPPAAPQNRSEARESAAVKDAATTAKRGKRTLPELERIRDEHGGELIEGVMKVRFDKDQKRANLHVPFSPPLAGMPDVECECVGGENLRLKVPVKQSYGIRIEARRSDASEPLEADVSFAAVYTPE